MFEISLEGLDNIYKKLVSLREQATAAIAKAVQETALAVEADAKKNCPVDRGHTRASITHQFSGIKLGDEIWAKVGSNLPSAPWMELGKPLRFPPVSAIEAWVRRKGIGDPKDSKGIAFLIARKLSKSGPKLQPFLYPALAKNRPDLSRKLDAAFKILEKQK